MSVPAGHRPTNLDATSPRGMLSLDDRCAVDERVAIRPEPFGALAYHYGNRRLVFLKHPDMVTVLNRLDGQSSVRDALDSSGIDPNRWSSFTSALSSLLASEIIHVR